MRKTILISIIIIFLAIGFLVVKKTKAAPGDNVFGWAWSENIGWISFNCYNDYGLGMEGHCIADGYNSDYGVHIDPATGNFSGYAWAGGGEDTYFGTPAATIGWIKLDPVGPYPEAPNWPACLDLPDAGQICDGEGDNTVSGWARAYRAIEPEGQTLGGWTGWIKLKGIADDSSPYGLQLDIISEEFQNWAWGGGGTNEKAAVIGWISFNCANRGVCGAATVEGGPSDYKVTSTLNESPNQPGSLSETWDYCDFGGVQVVNTNTSIILNWQYSDSEGDFQTAYEIWVDDNINFPDPKFNNLVEHTPLSGPDFSYTLYLAADEEGDWLAQLAWGAAYYWKVRVRDEEGGWSDWSVTDSFTMPAHAYPKPDFSWIPLSPIPGEPVAFTNETTFYNGESSYSWTFQDGDPDTFIEKDPPPVTFSPAGDKQVTLTATDSAGYSCPPREYTIIVSFHLPTWREITPF